ncbi:hypothetical protein FGO68_gene17647 [Halteria grandinella]|uniref:Uncharacterized protein n=1 Tax=Halteria grandinella TaxID=5974 RepID=A0A8J8T1D7_HALGN|nr:hypothetical protein FGO68_gene17647 [Halteria grandinella]
MAYLNKQSLSLFCKNKGLLMKKQTGVKDKEIIVGQDCIQLPEQVNPQKARIKIIHPVGYKKMLIAFEQSTVLVLFDIQQNNILSSFNLIQNNDLVQQTQSQKPKRGFFSKLFNPVKSVSLANSVDYIFEYHNKFCQRILIIQFQQTFVLIDYQDPCNPIKLQSISLRVPMDYNIIQLLSKQAYVLGLSITSDISVMELNELPQQWQTALSPSSPQQFDNMNIKSMCEIPQSVLTHNNMDVKLAIAVSGAIKLVKLNLMSKQLSVISEISMETVMMMKVLSDDRLLMYRYEMGVLDLKTRQMLYEFVSQPQICQSLQLIDSSNLNEGNIVIGYSKNARTQSLWRIGPKIQKFVKTLPTKELTSLFTLSSSKDSYGNIGILAGTTPVTNQIALFYVNEISL